MQMLRMMPADWNPQGKQTTTVPIIVFQILNIITNEFYLSPASANQTQMTFKTSKLLTSSIVLTLEYTGKRCDETLISNDMSRSIEVTQH